MLQPGMITASCLYKSYGNKKVLKNFSLSIETGEHLCIMGPSGCGKTTLLRMIMGLEKPDSGTISGVPEKISAVFAEDRLCEHLSGSKNLSLVLPGRADPAMIQEELKKVGLTESENAPVSSYSTGMKRRVAIVRGCLAESDLILMDEPFKGLDEERKEQVIQYVQKKTAGKTLIVVTHDPQEADALGGRVVLMGET